MSMPETVEMVFPVYAGVIPLTDIDAVRVAGVPRVCGGDPN